MANRMRRREWHKIVSFPFVETAASAVLAAIITLIDSGSRAGLVMLAFGIVLSLSRLAFAQSLNKKFVPVRRLCTLIDLNRRSPNPSFLDLINLYVQITEPEFRWVKDAVINETIDHLRQLSQNRRSKELETGSYYSWLFSMLERQSGGDIWAVSTLNPLEWTESAAEKRFVRLNKEAVSRGATLTRLFIVPRDSAELLAKCAPIAWHFTTSNVTAYIAIKEEVLATDPLLLKHVGDGFIAFDSRFAMIDVFAGLGLARGYVTANPQDIQKLRRHFNDLIKAYGMRHPAS